MRSLQVYFGSFFLFVVLFAVHRLVTFPVLRPDDVLHWSAQVKVFFVGSLSDLWVAQLLALLMCGVFLALSRLKRAQWFRPLHAVLMLASTIGLAGHQVYVQFFKFSLIPFHVLYLGDGTFLQSNIRSILGGPIIAHGLGLSLGYLLLRWVLRPGSWSPKVCVWVAISLFSLSLLAHNRNIHFRVQWFVPDNLQTHFLERAYKLYVESRPVAPLSNEEKVWLARQKTLPQGRLHPLAGALRQEWQVAKQEGRKPIFLILLMESMRPAEASYFAHHLARDQQKPSLTPSLDELSKQSVVFYDAYSSSSVTRGGQEAVFCGQWSSRDTSMMRGGSVHHFPCLPDMVEGKARQGEERGFTFWYHGGHPSFDNQKSFWMQRNTKDLMSQEDFGPEIARTDWGIGDLSFLQNVSERLADKIGQEEEATYAVGMALTVSHHIPWGLPADSGRLDIAQAREDLHPSYLTTAYADKAIGEFVKDLKQRSLWKDMLLVLVSDHGNSIPPYHAIYSSHDSSRDLRLESHVQILLSGGLVDRALLQQDFSQLAWSQPVSQVDIPSLFAYLQAWDDSFGQGENLFVLERKRPILSQLESDLFAPTIPARFTRQDYIQPPGDVSESERTRVLRYYRKYLTETYQAGSKPQ